MLNLVTIQLTNSITIFLKCLPCLQHCFPNSCSHMSFSSTRIYISFLKWRKIRCPWYLSTIYLTKNRPNLHYSAFSLALWRKEVFSHLQTRSMNKLMEVLSKVICVNSGICLYIYILSRGRVCDFPYIHKGVQNQKQQ